jgi:hypothetical protein
MATILWSDIHQLILPDVPGCPLPSVDSALAISASDFCARTHVWREPLDFQFAIKNIPDYDVDGSAVIESVLWAVLDGQTLTHIDPRYINKDNLTNAAKPTSFWVVNDTAIRLYPIPDAKYKLDIEVALKPARNADGIEDWIYESYIDPIVSGAIWRLARVPGKDWSNPEIAMYHYKLYEQGITAARIRDHRNTRLQVAQRAF